MKGLILYYLFEIQKQSTLEEAEEPAPEPDKRATTITSSLRFMTSLKVASRCSEDVNWKEQRAAATGQGIMRVLAGCEENVIDK